MKDFFDHNFEFKSLMNDHVKFKRSAFYGCKYIFLTSLGMGWTFVCTFVCTFKIAVKMISHRFRVDKILG